MQKIFWVILSILAISILIITCTNSTDTNKSETGEVESFASPRIVDSNPSPAHISPGESLQSFRVPRGYHVELVASEPMVKEPVAIAWDGNGGMYVAQMETYMQDVDATGEQEPISRIMFLEDTDNDGKMDKSSVFIDKLLLPRMILCVGKELLVNETNNYNIHAYKDSNGDGIADQKRIVYKNGGVDKKNLEHQRSGLDWNIDNWIYVTVDPVRFRYKNGMLKEDSLVSGSNGQWGLTHDNYGRLFFSRGGGENAGSGFQINPAYGQLEFKDAYDDSTFGAVWPIIKTPDVQGGVKRLRADTTLNHFTAGNGQSIFRGDKLPASLVGDYLINEPVARIIRRAKVVNKDGKVTLKNAYDQDEFIASSDMNFRPVNTYTGPDGCLYIVDMNRGIIQEGEWTKADTYLRPQIKRLGLDNNKQFGRIYRLVYDGMPRGAKPQMLNEPVDKLVTYLDHPNGWWRDNAQKEIVIRGDKSVITDLKQIALGKQGSLRGKPSALGRLHALWTLEGLEAADKEVLLKAMDDKDAQVRKAAVWISEGFLKKNDAEITAKLEILKNDDNYDVRTQLLLSLNYAQSQQSKSIVKDLLNRNPQNEMLAAVQTTLIKNEKIKKFGIKLGNLDVPSRKLIMDGATIYRSLCASCHGADGKGLSTKIAPPLIDDIRRLIGAKDTTIKILLHGLTGPVNGKTYAVEMPSMGANNDQWIASVLSYLRYDLGLSSRFSGPLSQEFLARIMVSPDEVKKIREQTAGRKKPWTIADLEKGAK